MKKWNYASVLGNSNLFFHYFTLHHFTKFLNDQTSNAMFIYLRLLTMGAIAKDAGLSPAEFRDLL